MSFSLDPGPDRRQWGDRATWLGHPYGRGRDSSECTLKLRHPRDVGQRSSALHCRRVRRTVRRDPGRGPHGPL